jgi:hypothetical protein
MKRFLLLLLILPLAFAFNASAQVDIEGDYVLYLPFDDEGDIAANDLDIGAQAATATYSDDGMFGGCAEFDGETTWIVMERDETITQLADFSWSFWMKMTNEIGTVHAIMTIGGNTGDIEADGWDQGSFGLFLGEDNNLIVDCSWVNGTYESVESTVANGEWHHVAVTVKDDAAEIKMYVDGALYHEEGWDEGISTAPDSDFTDDVMTLGYLAPGGEEPFPEGDALQLIYIGLLDDFRMYPAALSADEVTELFELEPTSVKGIGSVSSFAVYPNPASDFIRVKSITPERDLSIFNSIGQVVLTERDVQNGTMIDVSDLTTGLYMVKSGEEIQKLIVK